MPLPPRLPLKGTASRHHHMFIKVEGDITTIIFLIKRKGPIHSR
jgi:hypothetical protein